jgi:hypothetical protein
MFGTRTGMPVEVRITETSVGESSKLAEAFAVLNLVSTRLGSASDRPSSIFMRKEGVLRGQVRESKGGCFRKDKPTPHRQTMNRRHFNSLHFNTLIDSIAITTR